MIPSAVFYERRDRHCVPCEHWRGVCTKGHNLASPAGCPLRKFEPIQGAGYADDLGGTAGVPEIVNDCCNGKDTLPSMTWTEVLASFASSMVGWIRAGLPLADSVLHGERFGECKVCEEYSGFYCKVCRCSCYAKSKLLTEKCPKNKWKA